MIAWRVVLCLALCALSGCTGPQASAHKLRLSLPIDPNSLSPLIAFDQDQIALDQLWCQTLVGLDEHNRFIPILVTRVPSRENGDISQDGLRLTYHLRTDARFADGVALTSADVAFTYAAIFEPSNAAASTDAYSRIASLTTPNAHTVVIRLRTAWSAAVHVIFAQADFAYGILPKHAFKDTKITGSSWDRQPFGTGPFRVVAWRRGSSIELEPNPYFRPAPKLAHITVRIIPNQTASFDAFRSHAVDVTELNPDHIAEAARLEHVRVLRTPENGLRALYLQTQAPATNDLRVRRAIAFALNINALSAAWRQVYPRARSVFPAPLISWNAAQPPPYPYDIEAARRELYAAGWRLHGRTRMKNGEPLAILAATDATVTVGQRIAVIVQQQLSPLGISVTVKSYPHNFFSSPAGPLRTGRFSLTPSALIGSSDPEQSLNLICAQSRDGGENYARFCSSRFDRLFARQMAARTERQRQKLFDTIAALVHHDVPLVPLYDLLYIEGVDARVRDYARNMLRYPVRAEQWDAL